MVAYAGHLQADGNIVIENNAVRPGGTSESAGGGGAYVDADSSCYFSNGVVISNNQAEYGGGFGVPNFGGSALQWNIMENVKFTNNIAFKNAGGALFSVPTTLTGVVFQENTAQQSGGGAVVASTTATIESCSFYDNKALTENGGALLGNGQAVIEVVSSTIERNTALSEGGGIIVSDSSALTLTNTKVTQCSSRFHGGGVCTRGNSVLILRDDVSIRGCESLLGMVCLSLSLSLSLAHTHAHTHTHTHMYTFMSVCVQGGGLLAGGLRVTVTVAHSKRLVIEDNRAARGGGMTFMTSVTFEGAGTTVLEENWAKEQAGGLYGFSSYARMSISPDHSVVIQVCICACT